MKKNNFFLFTLVVLVVTSCALFEPYEASSEPKPSWPIVYESAWNQVSRTSAVTITLYESGSVIMSVNGLYGDNDIFDGYYYGNPLQDDQIRFLWNGREHDMLPYASIEGKYLFITMQDDSIEMTVAFKRK